MLNETTAGAAKAKLLSVGSFIGFLRKKPGQEPPAFPPPDWANNENADAEVKHAAQVPLPPPPAGTDKAPSSAAVSDATATASAPAVPPTLEEAPPPATVAQRIREMLASYSADGAPPPPPPPPPTGPNQPPPPPPAELDGPLAKFLESAAVMNGNISRGGRSVWEALERLRAPDPKDGPDTSKNTEGKHKSDQTKDQKKDESDSDGDSDDDSSIMLYAPLVPLPNSQVELAESETVRVDRDGKILEIISDDPARTITTGPSTTTEPTKGKGAEDGSDLNRRRSWWQIPKKHAKTESDSSKPVDDKAGEPLTAIIDTIRSKIGQQGRERKVWVASREKISLQISWWGYRIYLPPPVIAVLDDKSVEASKRAAMLTASFQWLLNKIPLAIFPPQARPAMMLAKRLVPYVGYLGAAVAWSWTSIKKLDKGNGVILSATWLLSVALIPSSWEENDKRAAPRESANATPQPGAEAIPQASAKASVSK